MVLITQLVLTLRVRMSCSCTSASLVCLHRHGIWLALIFRRPPTVRSFWKRHTGIYSGRQRFIRFWSLRSAIHMCFFVFLSPSSLIVENLFENIQDNSLNSFQVIICNNQLRQVSEEMFKQRTDWGWTHRCLLGCPVVSLHGGNALGIAVQVMWIDIINYFEWRVRMGLLLSSWNWQNINKHRKWHAHCKFLNGLCRLLLFSFVFNLKLSNSFVWDMTLPYVVICDISGERRELLTQ